MPEMTLRDGSVVMLVSRSEVSPGTLRWYCQHAGDDESSLLLRLTAGIDSMHCDDIMYSYPMAWIPLKHAGPTIDPNTAEVW